MGWSEEAVPAARAFHIGPLGSVSKAGKQIRILEIEYSCRRSDVVLNEEKLRQGMRSKKGGVYSQQVVDGDIESLYQTGDYTNVQIVTSPLMVDGEWGVGLSVFVDPRVRVSEVEVKRRRPDGGLDDNLSVKRDELIRVHPKPWETRDAHESAGGAGADVQNLTVTKAGEIVREERLFRDAVAMEECYREKGYKDVRIIPKTIDVKGEEAKLVFEVEEGMPGFIEEVCFLGNKEVGAEELMKVVALKPASSLSSKEESNCFKIEKLEIDLDRLKDLYANKGFLDVQVTASVDRFGEPNNKGEENENRVDGGAGKSREDLSLVFRISEGQRYGVEKIFVSGNTFFSENDILKELRSGAKGVEVFDCVQLKMIRADGLTRGRAYSVNGLQASLEILQNMYGREGFREARMDWRVEPGVKKGDLDIHFKITEGEKFGLERIEILGNTVTEDSVIRREIQLAPGEVFSTVKEKSSKENILKMGLFSNVETYAEETDRPHYQNLIIKVVEKPKELTFGFGVSYFWNGNTERSLVIASHFPFIIVLNFSQNWEVVFEGILESLKKKCRTFLVTAMVWVTREACVPNCSKPRGVAEKAEGIGGENEAADAHGGGGPSG
jgi:outer membrane protein insertion porin family